MGVWLEASTHTHLTTTILRFGFSDGHSDEVGTVSGEGVIQDSTARIRSAEKNYCVIAVGPSFTSEAHSNSKPIGSQADSKSVVVEDTLNGRSRF